MIDTRVFRRTALVLGWSLVALVAFSTLSPIAWRPHAGGSGMEHILAFALVASCLGIAYPGRLARVAAFVVIAAALLEFGQILVPDRHARLLDLVMKLVGTGIGLGLSVLADACLARFAGTRRPNAAPATKSVAAPSSGPQSAPQGR